MPHQFLNVDFTAFLTRRVKKMLPMVKKDDGNFGNQKSFHSFTSGLNYKKNSERQNKAKSTRPVYAIRGKEYYYG